MTAEPEFPAEWARRVQADLAASARPEAGEAAEPDGAPEWDEWYRRTAEIDTLAEQFKESRDDGKMRRAFLAGWSARDAVERRKAADDLTALTEELGLYDDGGGR